MDWRGQPEMHPSVHILDEMAARNWTRNRMAVSMAMHSADSPGICRLKLDLYLDVGPTDDRLRVGRTGPEIDHAFGLSVGFVQRLEDAWRAARTAISFER